MMIKKVSSLFVYLAVCICLLAFAHNAYAINHAASLEKLIRSLSPDYELPVIIHMSEKAAIGSITGKDKRIRTTKIVSALKDKANVTQAQLRSFLWRGEPTAGMTPMVNTLRLMMRTATAQ
jgi:hypothetical protein